MGAGEESGGELISCGLEGSCAAASPQKDEAQSEGAARDKKTVLSQTEEVFLFFHQ